MGTGRTRSRRAEGAEGVGALHVPLGGRHRGDVAVGAAVGAKVQPVPASWRRPPYAGLGLESCTSRSALDPPLTRTRVGTGLWAWFGARLSEPRGATLLAVLSGSVLLAAAAAAYADARVLYVAVRPAWMVSPESRDRLLARWPFLRRLLLRLRMYHAMIRILFVVPGQSPHTRLQVGPRRGP